MMRFKKNKGITDIRYGNYWVGYLLQPNLKNIQVYEPVK